MIYTLFIFFEKLSNNIYKKLELNLSPFVDHFLLIFIMNIKVSMTATNFLTGNI